MTSEQNSGEQGVVFIRPAKPSDLKTIAAIEAQHSAEVDEGHWEKMLASCRKKDGVALVAQSGKQPVGYLLGEIRAWEFGSPPTGWIYAVGVDTQSEGKHIGRTLLQAARANFSKGGAKSVRTMVERENVALLRFFRSAGFAAGPCVELEVGCD